MCIGRVCNGYMCPFWRTPCHSYNHPYQAGPIARQLGETRVPATSSTLNIVTRNECMMDNLPSGKRQTRNRWICKGRKGRRGQVIRLFYVVDACATAAYCQERCSSLQTMLISESPLA